MLGYINKLVEHLEWADTALLDALRMSPGSDSRALVLYNHVLGAEAVWLARIAGRPADVAVWPSLSFEDAEILAARNAAELRSIVSTIDAAGLSRTIAYRNSAGKAFTNTVEDILVHVALHGSYHRGQVALVMRGAGGEPASTDYIAFIRGAPAARTPPPVPIA